MHAKYQVAIFNFAKVVANVKVFGRTHRLTDRQTDGQFNCYMPPYRGHEKIMDSDKTDISGLPSVRFGLVHEKKAKKQYNDIMTQFCVAGQWSGGRHHISLVWGITRWC